LLPLLLVCALLLPAAARAALPTFFVRTTLAQPLDAATALEITADARIFVAEREGRILLFEGGVLQPTPVIELPADTSGERGLVGLALHPDFASNGYLYVYYTTLEPRNRVSRLTVVGGVASPASEVLIWQNVETAADYHHGGGLTFGPDGNLYISTGDQGASAWAQDLYREHGKILRVTPDGAIPPDNPYVGVPGARPAIWARGLRNPFRMTFDPPTGEIWIGDVGGSGLGAYEEVNRAAAGANYGWPNQEGPVCYVSDCSAYTFPLWSLSHSEPPLVGYASISLGPVYRGSTFPAEYFGNLFVGDYANRFIRRLELGPGPTVTGSPYFDTAPGSGSVVDLSVGPDGALYYVTVGLDDNGNPDPTSPSGLYRISYLGAGNQPPVAVLGANPASGPEPLEVQFSSEGSFDPDFGPQPLSYDWTFGDGGESSEANPPHTYPLPGKYTAQLTVSDGAAQASASAEIRVGRPPSVFMVTTETTYRAGDGIGYWATAVDPDDGSLPPAAFSWTVLLHHGDHVHPFLGPIDGVTFGTFQIPTTGHSPEDTFYEVLVTVTDSDGLDTTAAQSILPVISPLAFDTQPSGIPFFLDGAPFATPLAYESTSGFQHTVEAQAGYTLGGVPYEFVSWSDAGARVHDFVAPDGGATLLATYAVAGDPDGDGFSGPDDNCAWIANDQTDSGSLGSSVPNGIGDACECGDLDGTGRIFPADADAYRAHLADPVGLPLSADALQKCNVIGMPGPCTLRDVAVLLRALAAPPLAPGIAAACDAAQP
jgi:glucose/arabinose dehydrogenase